MYPQLFNEDFQHNKEILKSILITPSKKLRNQIAGYITHLVKLQRRQAKEETA